MFQNITFIAIMFRQAAVRNLNASLAARRAFHKSPVAAVKTPGEVAHDVNMGLGQGLASAIEKGEKVAHKAAETIGTPSCPGERCHFLVDCAPCRLRNGNDQGRNWRKSG